MACRSSPHNRRETGKRDRCRFGWVSDCECHQSHCPDWFNTVVIESTLGSAFPFLFWWHIVDCHSVRSHGLGVIGLNLIPMKITSFKHPGSNWTGQIQFKFDRAGRVVVSLFLIKSESMWTAHRITSRCPPATWLNDRADKRDRSELVGEKVSLVLRFRENHQQKSLIH